uniref:Uncharacterized protein n=1 Tax=Virgibacillus oceani TaxID=1479511 RepID=A0A917HRP9_9BACI|nr:hypothetical protein GCM10011398_37570 [Virgibacillus oceani]
MEAAILTEHTFTKNKGNLESEGNSLVAGAAARHINNSTISLYKTRCCFYNKQFYKIRTFPNTIDSCVGKCEKFWRDSYYF